jgi:IS5 family transposase
MHQTKKGNPWHCGMKAHMGADRDSGLVHTVVGTAANVADVTVGHALLHGQEEHVFADAGYQGAAKRPEARGKAHWHVAPKAGERQRWNKVPRIGKWIERAEKFKASVRAKVEHPLRVITLQFG